MISSAILISRSMLSRRLSHRLRPTLIGAGSGGGGPPAVLTSTAGHPLWTAETGWTRAEDLHVGDHLIAPSGSETTVAGARHWSATATVYNLTVNDRHTSYVSAGSFSVLAHNCEVEYGKTSLSRSVIQERLRVGNKLNNAAAARYTDATGAERVMVAFSSAEGHAEEKLVNALGKDNISEIYSELQPCKRTCRDAVSGIPQTWSWGWTTSASGGPSRKSQIQAIRGVFADAAAGNW